MDYTARPGISDVASADVNGDGKLDLVTANGNYGQGGQNAISVLLGNGDGTFQPPVDSSTLHAPERLRVGDFNHDGKPDAATVSGGQYYRGSDSQYLDVLLGNGDGTFQPPASYMVGAGPNNLALSDFNQDGNPDLVTANYSGNSLSVLLGKGDGTFQPPVNYPVTVRPIGIAVADYNKDGKFDLATAYYLSGIPGAVSIMLGRGDGTFQSPAYWHFGEYLTYVHATDLNQDGRADLITTSGLLNQVNVMLGQGNGTFQAPLLMYRPGPAIVSGDLDGDGKPDLAFGIGSIGTLTGKGDGTFETEVSCQPFAQPVGPVTLGDFNGDGKPDLAGFHRTSGGAVAVLLNQTTLLPPSPPVNFSLTYYPAGYPDHSRIGIGDYNNDGKPDLSTSGHVYYGKGDGTFQPPTDFSVNPTPITEAKADFNGDGIPDWAKVETACPAISIALGEGSGGYLPDIHYFAAGTHPVALAVGDLNGDGKPDLAAADYGYPNDAEGGWSLSAGKTIAVLLNTTDWHSPRHPGDVTGDVTVDVRDAIRLLQAVAGLRTLTLEERTIADTNCDGSVGMGDVVHLLRSVVFRQPLQACP
jgi:hypothetical protein